MRYLAFSILQSFLIIWHSQPNLLNAYTLKRRLDTYKVYPFSDRKPTRYNLDIIYYFWLLSNKMQIIFSFSWYMHFNNHIIFFCHRMCNIWSSCISELSSLETIENEHWFNKTRKLLPRASYYIQYHIINLDMDTKDLIL